MQIEVECAKLCLDAHECPKSMPQVVLRMLLVRMREMQAGHQEAVFDSGEEQAKLGRFDARWFGKHFTLPNRQIQTTIEQVEPVAEMVPRAERQIQAVA